MKASLGTILACGLLALGACSTPHRQLARDDGQSVDELAPPPIDARLTIFLIDGMRRDVMMQELEAGRLPELSRLIQGGGWIERGVTAFPSVTGYAYYPFLTGVDATRSGILGLRWMNRSLRRGLFRHYVGSTGKYMDRDIRGDVKLLFEEFPDAQTWSMNTFLSRGVTQAESSGFSFVIAKFKRHHWLPTLISRLPVVGKKLGPELEHIDRSVVTKAIENLKAKDPKVQWLTLPSPDTYSHLASVDERYSMLLRNIDAQISRYRAASREHGTEDRRIYAVLTDHGVSHVSQNLDLCDRLRKIGGYRCMRGPSVTGDETLLAVERSNWSAYDALVAINGNTMVHLYLSDPRARETRLSRLATESLRAMGRRKDRHKPAVDLVAELAALEGVELVVTRSSDGSVQIEGKGQSASGDPSLSALRATVTRVGDCYRYEWMEGQAGDPLGYSQDPELNAAIVGRCLTPDQWLAATRRSHYPYGPVRLHRLMSQDGAGDVVLTAQEGYDFGKKYEILVGNYRGGHGGLRADQSLVSWVLYGPGIEPGSRTDSTSEDIGATLRWLMSLSPAESGAAEGRVLRELLKKKPGSPVEDSPVVVNPTWAD